MSDVLLIFVAEDLDRAEALAAACEDAGLALHDNSAEAGPYRSALALWSEAAAASPQFHAAAHEPLVDGKALIANFTGAPAPDFMTGATAFDLSAWDGAEDAPVLAPLLTALQRRARYANILADLKTFAGAPEAEPMPDAAPAIQAEPAPDAKPLIEPAPALLLDTPIEAPPEPIAEPEPVLLLETPIEAAPAAESEPIDVTVYEPDEIEPAPAILEAAAEPPESIPEPIEAEFEPVEAVEPVAEITPTPPAPRANPAPQPRRRKAKPVRVRAAPAKRRADHKLHHLSQALLVSAGVFALVMIGGAFAGALPSSPPAPAVQRVAEAVAPPLVPSAAGEEAAPAEPADQAAEPERPAHARRVAPVLPPKLARAIAAQQLERAQWALAQEKLVKDQPQRSAEARLPASSRALASSGLSR
jgi:hypothetical protein